MNQGFRFLLFTLILLTGCTKEDDSSNESSFTIGGKSHQVNDYQLQLSYGTRNYFGPMVYGYQCTIYLDDLKPIFKSDGSEYQLRGSGWLLKIHLMDDAYPTPSSGTYKTRDLFPSFENYQAKSINSFYLEYVEKGVIQDRYYSGESAAIDFQLTEKFISIYADTMELRTFKDDTWVYQNAYLDFTAVRKLIYYP